MSAFSYVRGFTALHRGVDLAASTGTPIHAVAGGRVIYAGDERKDRSAPWYSRGGGIVAHVLTGPGDMIQQYPHMETVAVRVGQVVAAGDVIGGVDTTGNATGSHLHFALFVPHLNAFVDPLRYYTLAQLIAAVTGSGATTVSDTTSSGPPAGQVAGDVALLQSLGISTDPAHRFTAGEAAKLATAPPPGYNIVAGSSVYDAIVRSLTGMTVGAWENAPGPINTSDPLLAVGDIAATVVAGLSAEAGRLGQGLMVGIVLVLGLYLTLSGDR